MVKVREDNKETITDWYEETRGKTRGIVVETEDGYFEYWFPIIQAPDYVEREKALSAFKMEIVEAPDSENASRFTGTSSIIIPKKVVEKAEEEAGWPLLE